MHNLQISKPRYFISSLSKGLSVLQAFAEAGHPLTLSEIANALGANNTTATRLCYTLTELGFIQNKEDITSPRRSSPWDILTFPGWLGRKSLNITLRVFSKRFKRR
jgi:hypothetical protein